MKKKGVRIGITILIILLAIGIGILVYTNFFSPKARLERLRKKMEKLGLTREEQREVQDLEQEIQQQEATGKWTPVPLPFTAIKRGMIGEQVRLIQKYLNKSCNTKSICGGKPVLPLVEDGKFGDCTALALSRCELGMKEVSQSEYNRMAKALHG